MLLSQRQIKLRMFELSLSYLKKKNVITLALEPEWIFMYILVKPLLNCCFVVFACCACVGRFDEFLQKHVCASVAGPHSSPLTELPCW